jgi:hypothetical protein
MPENKTQVVGRIVFDITGHNWLECFEGSFLIPESTFAEAAALIAAQPPSYSASDSPEVAGRLARGILVDDRVTELSYLFKGKAIPIR